MSQENTEVSKEEIKDVSDDQLLVAAEEIVKNEELAKSEEAASSKEDDKIEKSEADLKGTEGSEDLAGPSGTEGPVEIQKLYDNGNEGSSTQEVNNSGENRMAEKLGVTKKAAKKNAGDHDTQDGDAQDDANQDDENRQSEKLGTSTSKGAEGTASEHSTQSGDAQDQANSRENRPMKLAKSVQALTEIVKSLAKKIETLEKSRNSEDEIRKSVNTDMVEGMATAYNKKINDLQKSNDELKESHASELDEIKKSITDQGEKFEKALGRPARTRETITNFDAIEKGNADGKGAPIYKSKTHVLKRLEKLRKSGDVTGDELIAYNASGNLSENAVEQLSKPE